MEELIKEIASELRSFRSESNKKIDSISQEVNSIKTNQALMSKDIEFIREEDAHQNKLLDEHIEGVKQVREQNIQNSRLLTERLESEKHNLLSIIDTLKGEVERLKAPIKWVKGTLLVFTSIGVISGAIYGVVKVLESFKDLPF